MIRIILLLCINGIISQNCQQEYRGYRGTINTYRYNSTSSRCTYNIKTSSPMWIKLTWRKFYVYDKMPSCYDHSVVIKTGCVTKMQVAKFCIKNMRKMPHPIYSPDGCMSISIEGGGGGFIAEYRSFSLPLASTCSRLRTKYTRLPGIVSSPGWPVRMDQARCRWRVKASNRQTEKIIVNIMDMNGYDYSSMGPCARDQDYVVITGRKSVTSKMKESWYYCRHRNIQKLPGTTTATFETEFYEMQVDMFVFQKHDYNRGFVIGFITYDQATERKLSWTSIVGGIAVACIVGLLAFCYYRRYKRRQMLDHQQPMLVPGTVIQPPPGPNAGYHAQQPYGAPPAITSAYPTPGYPADQPPPYQPPPYATGQGAAPGPYPAYPPPACYPPPQGAGPDAYPPPTAYPHTQGYPPYPQEHIPPK